MSPLVCIIRIASALLFSWILINQFTHNTASDAEDRLMRDLSRGYNYLIQPVTHHNETPLIVKLALQLVLLINVDERNQIMHTNMWLTLKWHDFQMKWNPVDYEEIRQIRVAPDKVWLPDIVLFNNADGQYEVSYYSNVVIDQDGSMLWVPPAIYKSSCIIDVEFFPFDEQVCYLNFGSWTYNNTEIKLEFDAAEAIDLQEFQKSSIWDVTKAPASRVSERSRIEYQVHMRRKTLFYTVVLIIPTVQMAFLNMAVFFLPADSGEKITLTISVLLSIVVFLLLVSKILPPTSSTIPLMAKYLLLTLVLNVITILVTVIIINVYFRGPSTHQMPAWVKSLFLDFCSRLLCMRRPRQPARFGGGANAIVLDGTAADTKGGHKNNTRRTSSLREQQRQAMPHHPFCDKADQADGPPQQWLLPPPLIQLSPPATNESRLTSAAECYPLTPDAYRAVEAIEYITDHLKQDEEYKMVRDDWKYVAMIIDRLLLYVFFGVTLGGTCGILLSAETIFDYINQEEILLRLKAEYKAFAN